MEYKNSYISPLGRILLTSDEIGLTGLAFEGQENAARGLDLESEEKETTLFSDVKKWLDIYFSGMEPDFQIPIHLTGTGFQMRVWEILCAVPYGETTTYGAIAKQIAHERGILKMSGQAVGNAVGRNPVSVIVPCHRVIGAKGDLTGYAGGIERKAELLKIEQNKMPLRGKSFGKVEENVCKR